MKTIQKNILRVFALFGLIVALTGLSACHHHGSNEPDSPDDKKDTIQPTDTFPKHDRPTWTVSDTTDLESTMTVTGSLPTALRTTADTSDLVAVFSENTCWGVTSVQFIDAVPYFFLYINRPRSATHTSSVSLTMRYYSAKTRYIFVQQDVFEFVVDGYLGTIESPFTPNLTQHE